MRFDICQKLGGTASKSRPKFRVAFIFFGTKRRELYDRQNE